MGKRAGLSPSPDCAQVNPDPCSSSPPPTCDDQFQVEGVLAGPVAGDAGVDAGVAAGHGLDDQGVHAVFPHQHLVGGVGADGLSVQLPDQVWGGQAAHLQAAEGAQHVGICHICCCCCVLGAKQRIPGDATVWDTNNNSDKSFPPFRSSNISKWKVLP